MSKCSYLMNEGWLFYKGEYELESLKEASPTCYASKSESGRGPAAYSFYDETWDEVNVPHDYAVLGTAAADGNAAHGYLHRGPAWYRRYFELYPEDEGKRIKLLFEGIATNCTVWVNGHLMKRHFTGFEDFEIDISEVVYYGEAVNVIAIRVDTELYGNQTEAFEGWWYDGAGIYRNVWLEKLPYVHIERYGIAVKNELHEGEWETHTEIHLYNEGYEDIELEINLELLSPQQKSISKAMQKMTAKALTSIMITFENTIKNVEQWSIDLPCLYTARVSIREEGKVTQTEEIKYGYRSIEFNTEQGFLLNGQPTKIKGTSNHQDHGALGVAVADNIVRWRIKTLKEMGCNAYRCAHNTVSPALLEACDEIGMLVMSENRWFTTEEENLQRVARMVKRERNHPSIIMWSVGNEEPIQCEEKGKRIAEKLIATIKQLDDSRPCTLAINGGFFERKAIEACDVIGMNYFPWLYDKVHEMYPYKVIIATEASCSNNCRGIYEENSTLNRFTAYDKHAPSFGNTHREAWQYVNTRPYVAGIFYWTGFEYRGETKWPSLFAEVGMIDSNGFKKDNYYLMQALWKTEPMIHILPHWSWTKENEEVEVWVYSNCETVELFLNGESLGVQEINPYIQGKWLVSYKAGKLKAVGRIKGRVASETYIETTGKAEKITFELMNQEVRANGEEVATITVAVVDEKGHLVPYATNEIHLSFGGDCEYLGSGASPIDPTPVTNDMRSLYAGLMQVYIRLGRTGKCQIQAEAEGIESAVLKLNIKPELGRPYIKKGKAELLIKKWWSSVVFDTPRTPESFKHRMPAEPGQPIPLFEVEQGYAMLSVVTKVPYYTDNKRISLYFAEITGKAEIWVRRRECGLINKQQVDMMKENSVKQVDEQTICSISCPEPCEIYYRKAEEKSDAVILDLSKKLFKPDENITIWVSIEGNDKKNGITGLVKWVILGEQSIRSGADDSR